MTIDADAARGGVTTASHVVLKMLLVSTSIASVALALVAILHAF